MTSTNWSRPLAAVAAIGLMGVASYFLFVGVPVITETIDGVVATGRSRIVSAVIPLVAGIMYLRGQVLRKRSLVVGSAVAALAYGVLFLFSVGLFHAPFPLLMLLAGLVASRHWERASPDVVDESAP